MAAMDACYATITGEHLVTIFAKSGPFKAVVLMASDRALLVYEPTSDHVSYLKFDEIQKIDWERPFTLPRYWQRKEASPATQPPH